MFNIALLGAGKIGSIHANNIFRHNEATLWSVVDPNADNAKRLAEKYGAQWYITAEDALADSNVDGVWIASASHTHADLIELAALHGKAIFCEKPIHLDSARVSECLATVKKHNVPLIIGFNRRFDPQFSRIKALADQGKIGKKESLLIISRDPLPPPIDYVKISGGLFKDMMIHDFDMARFIMGEDPDSIFAQGSNLVDPEIGAAGDIDTAFVTLKFPSGAIATIVNSRRSGYGYDQRIELHGSGGLLSAGNIYEDQVCVWDTSGRKSAPPEHFYLQRYKDAYAAELDHLVAVMGGKTSPGCSGEDGEKALLLALKAAESLKEGKEIPISY
ncbi:MULTISPECIES: inositol 2-dehydrogenase [unclassified Brenneria]|uniref:inositol 2-dehydrogenase n=1 Tax=unclassified Brenneria TaxID=2634434 RepID=UPI0015548090|nr:inositol 2-dehydrogenase [Brenneria sp. hezel4-2-4]MEE3650359.1 inositol 2-dehydrogenase [Brenneria sp. HEZEL_4_2_4]NPD00315.1 inositol 2-dehydrogenase [Brenneria sp. hezel4-2-4]